MRSLCYRGDICGVALFLPLLLSLLGVLGSWVGKGARVHGLHPCLPEVAQPRAW